LPTLPQLCEFAHWFPAHVAHRLEAGRLEGHQWRETTWTDQMLYQLRSLHDPRILVKASNEAATNADMDWWFVLEDGSQHLRLVVQAKILNYEAKNPALWAYPDIRHPPKYHGRQARGLRRYANKETAAGRITYPMYLFYNPTSADMSAMPYCPHSKGITLANGYRMVAHLEANRVDNSIPISAVRLSVLAPYMSCLPALFCQSDGGIPRPDEVLDALLGADQRLRGTAKLPPLRQRPKPGEGVPREVSVIIERLRREADGGDDDGKRDAPTRNTVIFLSDPW